ncbi:Glucose-induced degradation protein 4-like protein, partial [Drosera capensis]
KASAWFSGLTYSGGGLELTDRVFSWSLRSLFSLTPAHDLVPKVHWVLGYHPLRERASSLVSRLDPSLGDLVDLWFMERSFMGLRFGFWFEVENQINRVGREIEILTSNVLYNVQNWNKMPVRVSESSVPSQISGSASGQTFPQACSLLSVGQAFSGTQNVSSGQKDEAWRVNVRIQGCDLESGYLYGTMEALNVPMADTPVVTFWEGEIVDTKNYTFYTGKWEATAEDDIKHWTKFPSFMPLLSQVEADGGKSLDLSNYPYIFMRWKEQYFVNVGADCGLTIAGFYYVCFSCGDGSINGYYYDPNSRQDFVSNVVKNQGQVFDFPFQKLELKSTNEGRSGFSFSSYELV